MNTKNYFLLISHPKALKRTQYVENTLKSLKEQWEFKVKKS